jgi:hypothetical protein
VPVIVNNIIKMLRKFEGITQVLFSKTHKAREETEKLTGNDLHLIRKIGQAFNCIPLVK